MSDTIQEAIEANAAGPKRVSEESTTVEQHSIADQIAADNHIDAKTAATKPHGGMRFSKFVPPGTV